MRDERSIRARIALLDRMHDESAQTLIELLSKSRLRKAQIAALDMRIATLGGASEALRWALGEDVDT